MTNSYAAQRQRVHIQNYQQIDNYPQNIKFLRIEIAIETSRRLQQELISFLVYYCFVLNLNMYCF
jgi:hypothetical protein